MIWPVYLFYRACVFFVQTCKWIELQILKYFIVTLKRIGTQHAERAGVILHCPGDPEWTKEDTERVLSKCKKYTTLVHIKIHDLAFFPRVANAGNLGLGETYMEKMWDFCECEEDISEFAKRMFENGAWDLYYHPWNVFLEWLELYAFNVQTKKGAFDGVVHYETGNDVMGLMLGSSMQYTCAYWKDAKELDSAQIAKMDLFARKLDLKPGMRVLDIGCGWGTLCKYLAENYKVECVGITVAKEGLEYGRKVCKGLPVELRLQDYRDVNEKFDRIVCAEMLEHVGLNNYPEYFRVVDRCLKDDGLFVLHIIATQQNTCRLTFDPFSHKYISPNMQLPSFEDIVRATKKSFVIEDCHNIGRDFAKTYYAWRENFVKGWSQLPDKKCDERFYRMFVFYMSIARTVFSTRASQVWHIVFYKKQLRADYRAPR